MSETLSRLLFGNYRAKKGGPSALTERQRRRLTEMVAFARAHSPYYGDLYREVPQAVDDAAMLPVTNKRELMGGFEQWLTDRRVRLDDVRAFVDDPALTGERFLGHYTVVTTSGTTGTRGIFLVDDRSLTVTTALAVRMLAASLDPGEFLGIVRRGGRMAMVIATGGHFASIVAATRLRKTSRRRAKTIGVLSVHTPPAELVSELNRWRPVILAPYASMGLLLAGEQEAGRLQIDPVLAVLSAEGLPLDDYDRIAAAFGAKVGHGYAATECPFLSYSCEQGWLHVNSDWVVVEPVDADYRPTPPGHQSHTVLITNLANRVQPILRYDLGDAVLQRPDPCPCGDPLPAIRVQGRAADVLTFPRHDAATVTIAPLAFTTLADRTPGVERFQIVQTTPTTLRVRLQPVPGGNGDEAWQAVQTQITQLLHDCQLTQVAVERATEPPEQSQGGKYRPVIPLVQG